MNNNLIAALYDKLGNQILDPYEQFRLADNLNTLFARSPEHLADVPSDLDWELSSSGVFFNPEDLTVLYTISSDGLSFVAINTTVEEFQQEIATRIPEIANYAALDAYTGALTSFYVRGVANLFDGGHGIFRRTTDTPAAADGVYRQDGAGRWWRREFTGELQLSWFGFDKSGVTDSTDGFVAFVNAVAAMGITGRASAGVCMLNKEHVLFYGLDKIKIVCDDGFTILDHGWTRTIPAGVRQIPWGVEFSHCANVEITGGLFMTPALGMGGASSGVFDSTNYTQRRPVILFWYCGRVMLDRVKQAGDPGVGMSSADRDAIISDLGLTPTAKEYAYFPLRSAFMCCYECDDVVVIDNELVPDTCDGERFTFVGCKKGSVIRPKSISVGNNFASLGKVVHCTDFTIDDCKVTDTGTGSLWDIIGKNITLKNTHIDYPNGKLTDVSHEWNYANGPSDNILIADCSTTGLGVVYATGSSSTAQIVDNPITNVRVRNVRAFKNGKPDATSAELITGTNLSGAGFADVGAGTSHTDTTITTAGVGGVTISKLQVGSTYTLVVEGSTTASGFSALTAADAAASATTAIGGFGTHTFVADRTFLYLQNLSAGITTLTNFSLHELHVQWENDVDWVRLPGVINYTIENCYVENGSIGYTHTNNGGQRVALRDVVMRWNVLASVLSTNARTFHVPGEMTFYDCDLDADATGVGVSSLAITGTAGAPCRFIGGKISDTNFATTNPAVEFIGVTMTGVNATASGGGSVKYRNCVVDGVLTNSGSDGSVVRIHRKDTSITVGEEYGGIEWSGDDSSSNSSGVRASLKIFAEGSGGDVYLSYSTAPYATAALSEHLRVYSNGNVAVFHMPTSAPATSKTLWNDGGIVKITP